MSFNAAAIELARVEGFGPVSRGMAGGGVAYPVGAAAMLLNPAELLNLETEQEVMLQLTDIHVDIRVQNATTGEQRSGASLGNNRDPYSLPELAYARRWGRWAAGTGVFAAGGFGVEYGTDSFLSRTTTNNVETGLPASVRVGQVRIPFALAWTPAERWRLGASFDVVNASMNLGSLIDVQQVGMLIQAGRATGSLVPTLASIPDLSGAHLDFIRDDPLRSQLAAWGVAGRLGLSFQLSDATSLAAAYEFQTALDDLKGKGTLTAVDKDNHHITLVGEGRLPEFQFPQAFVLGAAHRFTPNLAVTFDLRRTFWAEVLQNTLITFRTEQGDDLQLNLPTGFNNLTTLGLGVEWQFLPQWKIRAGGSRALQPVVPGDHSSGTFPTLTRNHLASTLSYRYDVHQIDLGCSYGFTHNVRNPGGNANSMPALTSSNRQTNIVIGYSYHF